MILGCVRGMAAGIAMAWLALHAAAWAADPPFAATPAKYRGLWFQGNSCASPRGFKLISRDLLYSGTLEPNGRGQFVIWTYRTYEIYDRPEQRIGVHVHDKISIAERVSDRMFQIQTDLSDTTADFFRCDSPAVRDPETKHYVEVLRRVASVLADYDKLEAVCRPLDRLAHGCAEEIVHMADINGDGKISPAELTSFMRRAVSVGMMLGGPAQQGGREIPVGVDELADLDTEAAMFAPFIARTAFANLDFNNDGFLSVEEIATGLQREDFAAALLNGNRVFGAGTTRAAEAYAAFDGLTRLFGVGKPGL